ncbi:ATP-binding protein [Aquincola sp. MAHUQ-54]|uniref:histidine kinase n=1 Tax=Aquincola agrisoli TaxID=3119538 RepID=A0AAW9QL93_9BURK
MPGTEPSPDPLHSPATWRTWRQIVDSAVDTALIATDRAGKVVIWSEGAHRLLGWTEAEMQGQDLSRLFTDEDRQRGRFEGEMAEALAQGRGGGEEGWRLRRGGERFWAIGELTPIRDDRGAHTGFVKILRDRTAQRRNYETLVEKTRALEVLNRATSALAAESDVQRVVQIVTDAGVELTGAEFGAFFHNVVDDAGESYMLYTLSGAPPEAFSKFPMPRKTPVFAPTFDGEGIVRSDDITQDPRYGRNPPRRGMPEGHLPVRSYLAVPVRSRNGAVIGGLFFGHQRAGVFTDQSEAGLQGLAGEAAVAIDNARLAKERRAAEQALRNLNERLEQEVQQRTQELERNAEALRQSQKMEAIGQLTGGVAHDFNNLLQVIIGNLEMVRRNAPADAARLIRAANTAMNGARRAAALTQRLLAFARRQPLAPKALDINVLVHGLSELLHRTLGETIALETVLSAGLWRVEADPTELENAVLNLAVNARDAMAEGGRLTIETANAYVDEAYAAQHAEVAVGQYVVLSVSDTGVGMEAQTLQQVFEPFFTTKPVGQGTGLGLSQVYGFVKQSGGHVKIYSEPGLGTTVRIYLPRLHRQADPETPAEEGHQAPEGASQETVLVVEDDPDVRSYAVDSLRELGYRVLEAADGPAALAALQRQRDVSLLFTDVVLPGGMTGAQLAAQAHGLSPALRVLFTTGYARNAIVHHGRLDAGVDLLTKPYTFAELASRVRDVLDKA